jgi:DNA mismatch repair ATPase MutS
MVTLVALQCGCSKDAFPSWAAKVLALGFSVGRVEEVKRAKGAGNKDGVLERKLVRIYTPGTAIDSFFDDSVSATRPCQ